jgi:hypothetical protein
MKYLSLLTTFAAFQVAVSAEEAVSFRIVVNQGKSLSPKASCTRPEFSRIQSILVEAIKEVSKENLEISPALRGKATKPSVNTSFCWEYCRGTAPGTCWVLDARCSDMRRYWQVETPFRSNSVNLDLRPNMLLEDDLNDITRCHSDKQTIQNAIQTTLQSSAVSITHSCKNMLHLQIDVTCVKVPENTDKYQSQ